MQNATIQKRLAKTLMFLAKGTVLENYKDYAHIIFKFQQKDYYLKRHWTTFHIIYIIVPTEDVLNKKIAG